MKQPRDVAMVFSYGVLFGAPWVAAYAAFKMAIDDVIAAWRQRGND